MNSALRFAAGTAILLVLLSHAADARSTKVSCPLGLPSVFCLVEPCTELTNDKCIDDSKATCRVDTCTGCKRHFVDSDGKRIPSVQCDCLPENRVECAVNPCSKIINPGCKSDDSKINVLAKCEADTCGGCRRRWFVEDKSGSFEVTDICEPAALPLK